MSQQSDTSDAYINDVNANTAPGDQKKSALSRRDFLKYSAGAVGAASVSGILAGCSGGYGGGYGGGHGGGDHGGGSHDHGRGRGH